MSSVEREAGSWGDWAHRWMIDGRLLALEPLLMGGARLHVVTDATSTRSSEIFDFQDADRGVVELFLWSGEGEPEGWYRHRPSNRRRPGGDPSKEYVAE